MMNLDSIGSNLKKHRLAKKLRQEDLAEIVGLSANYIGMIERGEKIPSLETFVTLLNALEASADVVLSDIMNSGYLVKNAVLDEKMRKLSYEDRDMIYDVIDILMKHLK